MADLNNEIELVCSRNAEFFEFSEDHQVGLRQEFKDAPKNSVERALFYDWMLNQESFFMIFSNKNELAEIVEEMKGQGAEAIIQAVESTWKNYRNFLDDNMQLLMRCFKDLHMLIDREKEAIHSGFGSISIKTEKGSMRAKRNNGVIYHDFNYPDYVNSRFEQDETMAENLLVVPREVEVTEEKSYINQVLDKGSSLVIRTNTVTE